MSIHTVSFESTRIGAAPEGWTATLTGKGDPKWTVESDEAAPSKSKVLKQATYPLLLKNDTNIRDGFIEVKFKAIAGSQDRAAGVVWRARDANNYYIVRVAVPANAWHSLRVDFKANRFRASFNGHQLFEVEDSTFTDAGMVGLWTKADSVTLFDQMTYGDTK